MLKNKFLNIEIKKSFNTSEILYFKVKSGQTDSINLKPTNIHKILISRIFQVTTVLVFLFLTFRLAIVQVYTAPIWQEWAYKSSNQVVYILPPRGRILDRNGKVLADNEVTFSVVTSLRTLQDQVKKDAIKVKLDLSEKDLEKAVKEGFGGIVKLKKDLSSDEMLKFSSIISSVEVEIVPEYSRSYLNKVEISQKQKINALSSFIGYTGVANETQAKALNKDIYKPDSRIGVSGFEKAFESDLQGIPGRIERRSNNKNIDSTDKIVNDPVSGKDLKTTIDLDLQLKLYDIMKEELEKAQITSGSVIVLNAENGEIKTILNFPNFDPSSFEDRNQQYKLSQYFTDKLKPLFNRSLKGLYPPGSSIKPFVGAVAMQEGVIKPGQEILDTGVLQVRSKSVEGRVDQYINYKSTYLGVLDLNKAIAKSSDLFFYFLVGGDPETGKIPLIENPNSSEPLGVIKLDEGLKKYFGFGEVTGVDFDLENRGVLPTPEYKQQKGFGGWFLGDAYQTAIGQGYFLSTPIQMARATAVLANGGYLINPHIAMETQTQKAHSGLRDDVLEYISKAMRSVVLEGTARRLQDNKSQIAAKTGSAQFDPSRPEQVYGWVVSYNQSREAIKDSLVVVVLTEDISKTAEYITVPITNRIWQELEASYNQNN